MRRQFTHSRPAGSANSRTRQLFDREGLAAAAGRRRVRVLDGKAAAGDGIDEVDFGAVQISDADGIDEQPDAMGFEHLIAGTLTVFLNHQAVLEARTAASLHEHSQAAPAFLLFREQLTNLRRSRFGYVNHGSIIAT